MSSHLRLEWLEKRDVPTVAFQTLPILPFSDASVLDHAQAIVGLGQQLGQQVNVLLKIGDSNSAPFALRPPGEYNPGLTYLAPLGSATYNPGASGLTENYGNLRATWKTYHSSPDSLAWQVPTAYPGWTTSNVLTMLNPTISVTRPGIAFIMIGTNDAVASVSQATFTRNLNSIVDTLTTAGVLPILSTIPDVEKGTYHSTALEFNQLIANVAVQDQLPLWNAWAALNPLPNHGLDQNGIHLTTSPRGGGSFWSADMQYGQNVRNLETLQILNWFQNSVVPASLQSSVSPQPTWQPMTASSTTYVLGPDLGSPLTVDVGDPGSGTLVNPSLAIDPSFVDEIPVTTADAAVVPSTIGVSDTLLVGNGPSSSTSSLAGHDLAETSLQLLPDPGSPAFGIFVG